MVLSVEDCSHRKSITNTWQGKVPNNIALCVRDIHGDALLCSFFNFVNHWTFEYRFRVQNTTNYITFGHSFR